MLRVTNLAGFGGGVRLPPTKSYGETQSADSPPASASFTMTFGAAGGNRRVAVAIAYLSTTAINSVTIGGVTASQVDAAVSGSARSCIWVAEVPSGTSGNVAISGHDGVSSGRAMAVSIYSIYNLLSDTARSHGNDASSPYSISLTTALNDVAIGCMATFVLGGAATHTWTNLTENVDGTVAIVGTDFNYSMASAAGIAAGTLAASVVPTTTGGSSYVAANWGQ